MTINSTLRLAVVRYTNAIAAESAVNPMDDTWHTLANSSIAATNHLIDAGMAYIQAGEETPEEFQPVAKALLANAHRIRQPIFADRFCAIMVEQFS